MRAIISASESLSLWYHNFKEAVDVKSWNQSELSLNCFHTAFLKIKNKKTINNKSIVIFYFILFFLQFFPQLWRGGILRFMLVVSY